jgi:cardiolipin synthase
MATKKFLTGKSRQPRVIYTDSFKLVHSGTEYFSALQSLIDAAVYEIHFQTYIFLADETGRHVADALLRAAHRGVKIYLLLDAYGSGNLSKELVSDLLAAGIEVRFFGKLFSGLSIHIGRRLHRKIILADGKNALIGGINISNQYNSLKGRIPWLDYAILFYDFPSNQLYRLCQERWLKPGKKRRFKKAFKPHFENSADAVGHSNIKINENDYLRGRNMAAKSYFSAILHAKQSLFIVGGYFLPGGKARRLLRRAAQRGVDIRVILAAQSDVALNRNAVQYLYQWLLRNNMKIYEYKPANVHGKVLIADKTRVCIGSYDLNNLSTYSNIELNLDIHNPVFASQFYDELEEVSEKDCKLVTVEDLYKRSNLWKRFKHWFSYHFVKTLFSTALWLANRKDETYQ